MKIASEGRSAAAGRKHFYDWLDRYRPWADGNTQGMDAYGIMERVVDAAAWAFVGDQRPTQDDIKSLSDSLIRFTSDMEAHPEGYDGPCACFECRSQD